MVLYKNRQDFKDAVVAAASYYHVSPAIVEKDYFVTVVLKKLKESVPGILFKGGTSLSKCFKVIERFSEDIDMTLDMEHFTQSNKRNANKKILSVCDELGFKILNREDVELHSHGNYNVYDIEYPVSFSAFGIKPYIKLEMTFIQKAYPDVSRSVSSFIGEYIVSIGKSEVLQLFELESFPMRVQSLERTFVDKIFVICDYYLRNEVYMQSRHIYDISKLIKVIDWKNLQGLVCEVRSERKKNKTCVSAQKGVSIPDILNKIVETNYYKKDYEEVTWALLNEKISYDEAIFAIKEIADNPLFV